MCRVIIVDDEKIIRQGIFNHIKRTHSNIVIDQVFADGQEAIEYLTQHDTDIVITDVRMSVKSGIDVAEYVYYHKPETKVIFLSGYKEFEYAQQAIRFNVKYYLSKPVKVKELSAVLNELSGQIASEQERQEEINAEKERYQNLLSVVKRDFYVDILFGSLNSREKICKRAAKFNLTEEDLNTTKCAVLMILIKEGGEWHYGQDDFYTSLYNLLRDMKYIDSFLSINQEKRRVIMILESKQFDSWDELGSRLEEDLIYLKKSALELLKTQLEFQVLFQSQDIWSLMQYKELNYSRSSNNILLQEKQKELASKIISSDKEGAQEILEDLKIYAERLGAEQGYEFLRQLFETVAKNLEDRIQIPEQMIEHKLSEYSKDSVFDWCDSVMKIIFQFVETKSSRMEEQTVKRAKEYINQHFAEDVALEDVAGYVYLNPIYFSRFFKQHTGTTMTEYLTQVRMNAAIELFKTHKYKVYTISEMCGYKSSKYFAKAFKEFTGYTPTEYSRLPEV